MFLRMFTRIGCEERPPHFHVEFYPYSSLVITIRRREEVVYVRFSDLLRRAPASVLEGAAALLLARVYRRRTPRALVRPYLEYARSDRTRSRISQMRGRRVRLAHTAPQGKQYDLAGLFDQLNQRYFAGALQRPLIGWSLRSWRRQFGCYDPGPNQILLNRRMDQAGDSAICRGVRALPRDAAREASHTALRVQPDFPFAGVSRGGEAV